MTINYTYTQADWGWSHPRPFRKHSPVRMELHHSVIPADRYSTKRHAQIIHQMHLNKGWNGIFYNVGVNPITGEIIECRGEGNLSTATALDALTVCVFGDLRTDTISRAASNSLLHIIDSYPQTPRGHRERPYPTECPSRNGMAWLDAYRSGDLEPLPPPPPPDGDFEHMSLLMFCTRKDGTRTASFITSGEAKRKVTPDEAQWHALLGLIPSATPVEVTETYFDSIPTIANVG